MGTLADSLFAVLMSWVRALVSGIWALFSSEHTTVLEFLGKNWWMIALVLIASGLVIDWLIWLVRWQPYHIWAQRVRRMLRLDRDTDDDDETEEEDEIYKAHAAMMPERKTARMPVVAPQIEEEEEHRGDLFIDKRQEQEALDRASEVPDEALGAYPGMRYGVAVKEENLSNTQRYSALTAEGPGSAEVARRRAEIEAWQQQMQEEARSRAQAEHAAREAERLMREAEAAEAARIAEEERLMREAEEAEAARIAEEERLAQEEYARQLAEYEIKKAQYERELAEYERQKAAYDAQMAKLAAQDVETAQEIMPQTGTRRRRAQQKSYSDYVSGEAVTALPDPPAWPKMETPVPRKKKPAPVHTQKAKAQKPKAQAAKPQTAKKKASAQTDKPQREHKLLSRVAKLIEPQEEELSVFKALPPRVDMHEAYKPAKTPKKPEKRQ